MDKWTNDSFLKKKGVTGEGLIFFYQRWSELLNSKTLDSYQYQILNTHVALIELLEVINGIHDDKIHIANLTDCINETLILLQNDDILNVNAIGLKNRLLHHLGSSKNKKLNEATHRLKYQIQYCLAQIDSFYLDWIFIILKDAISENNFELIDKYSSYLVSECIYIGWSVKTLYNLRNIFEDTTPFDEKWVNFINKIKSDPQDFQFNFKFEQAKGIAPEDMAKLREQELNGLEILLGSEIISNNPQIPALSSKISAEHFYIVCNGSGYDVQSTVLQALEKINHELNIFAFYKIIAPWLLKVPIIVVIESDRVTNLNISTLFEVNDYVDNSIKIFQTAQRVLNNGNLSKDTYNKLQGTFLYYNLAQLSFFQEVKFLNLWVALESFVRTGQHDSIITHIKEIIPPLICVRFFYRLFRNFAADCERCNIQIENSLGGVIDYESESKTEMVAELISIFKDAVLFQKLHQKCESNSLLKYRCIELKVKINNLENIANTLKNHNLKITWHLQRLYRVRNEITHSAYFSNKSIISYIKNLSEYLSIIVTEVIFQLDKGIYSCIEEVFEALVDNYKIVEDILETKCTYDIDLLKDGVIDVI